MYQKFQYVQRSKTHPSSERRHPFGGEKPGQALLFLRTMQWVLSRGELILSTKGLLAFIPKATAQYDSISRITGVDMPHVLHPTGENGQACLIGRCYVHGIMHCLSFENELEMLNNEGSIFIV